MKLFSNKYQNFKNFEKKEKKLLMFKKVKGNR